MPEEESPPQRPTASSVRYEFRGSGKKRRRHKMSTQNHKKRLRKNRKKKR